MRKILDSYAEGARLKMIEKERNSLDQMCAENQRQKELRKQLEAGVESVKAANLLPPKSRTRPGVGLVGSYDKVRQRMLLAVPPGVLWASVLAIVALVISALDGLVSLGLINLEAAKNGAAEWLVWGVLLLSPIVLLGLTLHLMGKISIIREALDLDLNGIYHEAPQGRCYTPWSKVVNSSPLKKTGIRLFLDDGGVFWFHVPKADRDGLVEEIGFLILHHQPDDLLGKQADRSP